MIELAYRREKVYLASEAGPKQVLVSIEDSQKCEDLLKAFIRFLLALGFQRGSLEVLLDAELAKDLGLAQEELDKETET